MYANTNAIHNPSQARRVRHRNTPVCLQRQGGGTRDSKITNLSIYRIPVTESLFSISVQ